MAEPSRIPFILRVSAIDAMFEMASRWATHELKRRAPRKKYVSDLVDLMSLLRGAEQKAVGGLATVEVNEHWSAIWVALLRDVQFPEAEDATLVLAAEGWPAERPRHWPDRPESFML